VLFRCNCTGGGGIDETRRVERPPLAGRLTRDAALGTTQSSGNCKAREAASAERRWSVELRGG
jgi:hypothetical protein